MARLECEITAKNLLDVVERIQKAEVSKLNLYLNEFAAILNRCSGSLTWKGAQKMRVGLGITGCSCENELRRRKR